MRGFRRGAVVIVAVVALAGCGPKPTSAAPDTSMQSMAGMPGMGPGADSGGVPIDRASAGRLGIGFSRATVRPVRRAIRLTGTLAYAEPRRVYLNARVSGWVEHLYADYAGKAVAAGEPLLALYSPELVSGQEEYLAARRLGISTLMVASRRRLELWGVPADQIALVEQTGLSQHTLLLRAPHGGEIAEKMVTEGQAVHAGDNLFLIADRSVLWVDVAVFEMDARTVRIGTPVSLTVQSQPGRSWPGRVTFIQPVVDPQSRTLTARVQLQNQDGLLRPGMYAVATLAAGATSALSVPVQAVLPTGTRNLVFVNRGDGTFMPRPVITGVRGDSLVEIISGLKAGDEVVSSAAYLLDSESNLGEAMQGLMLQMGMGLDMGGMAGASPGAAPVATADTSMRGMKMPGLKKDSAAGGPR